MRLFATSNFFLVQVLECLAIVTLVGAEDFSDTERSMKVIWQLVCPDLGSNVCIESTLELFNTLHIILCIESMLELFNKVHISLY